MATRNSKKLALSVLGLGAATAAVVFGSWATWTAQTTNPNNQVTAGTLTMYNSKGSGNPVLTTSVSNVKPGDSGSDNVTIRNDGSVDFSSIKLTQSSISDFTGDTSNTLQLKISDTTTGRCIWPEDDNDGCGTWGAWDGSSTMTNFTIKTAAGATETFDKDPDGAGAGTGEAHVFNVAWRFTNGGTSDNDSQGDTASFNLTWDGAA